MREWQQDLVMYRITPAPPKMELQEYIELYCKEKDEKYFLWFLHYYENTLNTKVMGWVQNYAMPGHFQDMKQAFIIGMWKALQEYDLSRDIPFVKFKENTAKREIHEYIRKMRRGFTVQSFDEDLRLRKAMRLFYESEEKTDDATMQIIADEIGVTKEKAEEIICSGLQNTKFVEFYRQYADEDDEESREEVASDDTSRPDVLCVKFERANLVMDTFEEALNYRERALVSEHLAFCRECYSTEITDYENPDYKGNPTNKQRKPKTFEELAFDHRVSSPATADSNYRKALNKMKKKLIETGYDF